MLFLEVKYTGAMSKLIFAGDTVLHGKTRGDLLTKSLLEDVGEYEVFCCNLEAPCNGIVNSKNLGIKFNENNIKEIKRAGINICCLANNHSLDCDMKGLHNTIIECEKNGLNVIGASCNYDEVYKPYIYQLKNGCRVAIFAFTHKYYGSAPYDMAGTADLDDRAVLAILNVKNRVDFVIVNAHCGLEDTDIPLSVYREKYHFLIDIGVDIVVGHHSHVVQNTEKYKNGYIAYSLGNFCFDLEEKYYGVVSEEWYKGLVLEVNINNRLEYDCAIYEGNYGRENGVFSVINKSTMKMPCWRDENDYKEKLQDLICEEGEGYLEYITESMRQDLFNVNVLHHFVCLDEQSKVLTLFLEQLISKDKGSSFLSNNLRWEPGYWKIKKVVVWGNGITGRATYRYLIRRGMDIVGFINGLIEAQEEIDIDGKNVHVYPSSFLRDTQNEDVLIVIASTSGYKDIVHKIHSMQINNQFVSHNEIYRKINNEEINLLTNMNWEYKSCIEGDYRFRVNRLNGTQKDKIILYLHGAGCAGCDNMAQVVGLGKWGQYFIDNNNKVDLIAPQCPHSEQWINGYKYEAGYYDSQMIHMSECLKHIIEMIVDSYGGKSIRIMGFSMGAFATWYLLEQYPLLFEKALIISGGGSINYTNLDVKTKIRLIHGDADTVVPIDGSSRMVDLYNKNIEEYIKLHGIGHDIFGDESVDSIVKKQIDWIME